jgi:hypothetical protein
MQQLSTLNSNRLDINALTFSERGTTGKKTKKIDSQDDYEKSSYSGLLFVWENILWIEFLYPIPYCNIAPIYKWL